MNLDGAVIIVTGASRGIGRAVSIQLASRGARVIGVARQAEQLESLDRITQGHSWATDLTQPSSALAVVEHAVQTYGRIDGVVLNAGLGHVGATAELAPEKLSELVDTNLRAPLFLAQACLGPLLSPNRSGAPGAVLFVSSIAGVVGVPEENVYSVTKAAVETFSALLREELHRTPITVATVIPGVVRTDLLARREVPYARSFPRPVPPERVATAVLRALEGGRQRTFVPRWLAIPARINAVAPKTYRALARRFG